MAPPEGTITQQIYSDVPLPQPQKKKNNQQSTAKSMSSLIDYLEFLPSYQKMKLGLLIILWYSCSSLTNNLGKQLLNEFDYPLTLTFVQFGMISVFTWLYVVLFKPLGDESITPVSRSVLVFVFPLVIFSIIGHSFHSIAISNIPVNYVHTVKALAPFFTVIFSKIFLKAKITKSIYISLIPLVSGVILACSSEIGFHPIGLSCALFSAIVFVGQNIFSKKLFQEGKMDELNLLFYSASLSFLGMLPYWLLTDAPTILSGSTNLTGYVALLFLANGITHFGQCVFAFTLMTLVNPVTYSVASLMKRVFIIVSSIIWFSTKILPSNTVGLFLTFLGLWLYNQAKSESKHPHSEKSILPTHFEQNGVINVQQKRKDYYL